MSPDKETSLRRDLLIAAALVAVGLAISAMSLTELRAERPHLAQATQPLQPSSPADSSVPAESKPGGTRPTTPAPEPARPDAEAQQAGARPALPPAPAEKMAPPITPKQ
jgi:hypothetical protein